VPRAETATLTALVTDAFRLDWAVREDPQRRSLLPRPSLRRPKRLVPISADSSHRECGLALRGRREPGPPYDSTVKCLLNARTTRRTASSTGGEIGASTSFWTMSMPSTSERAPVRAAT
jgi:hypothetical protein